MVNNLKRQLARIKGKIYLLNYDIYIATETPTLDNTSLTEAK